MKEAGTYGPPEGTGMPIWVEDDGTFKTQSMAILKFMAHEHGFFPQTPAAMFEAEWYLANSTDHFAPDGSMKAYFAADANEEQIAFTI